MNKFEFKPWSEIKDKVAYFNSDNVLSKLEFKGDIIAELRLDLKSNDDKSAKTMTLKSKHSLLLGHVNVQMEFNEENYNRACKDVTAMINTYINQVIESYTTESSVSDY